jgi:hypothetical protein
MAASFGGIMTGASDMFLATGGKSMQIFSKQFFESGGKFEDAMNQYGAALLENRDTIKGVAQVGGKFGPGLRKSDMIINKDYVKGMEEATKANDDAAAGTNAATNAQSKLRDNQINSTQAMQSLINLGVTPLTSAMQGLTQIVNNLTSMLPGGKPTTGYGQGGTGTLGKSLASTGAGAAAGAAAGALAGPVGAAVGGIVGGVAGYMGYQFGGGGGLTGKTEGLEQDFMEKLQGAAREYQEVTGQPLNIVSGKRTADEQAKLYADYQAGKSKFPAAPPGQSQHESGRAVDVSLDSANKLDSMGLLAKYGLSRPVPNDPIHIQGSAGFRGSLSGPMSGYSPNLLFHGDEDFTIRPKGGSSNDSAGASEGSITRLADKTDDMIQLMRAQLAVNEKILKYQQ